MKIYFKQTRDDWGKTKCFDEFYFIYIEFEGSVFYDET